MDTPTPPDTSPEITAAIEWFIPLYAPLETPESVAYMVRDVAAVDPFSDEWRKNGCMIIDRAGIGRKNYTDPLYCMGVKVWCPEWEAEEAAAQPDYQCERCERISTEAACEEGDLWHSTTLCSNCYIEADDPPVPMTEGQLKRLMDELVRLAAEVHRLQGENVTLRAHAMRGGGYSPMVPATLAASLSDLSPTEPEPEPDGLSNDDYDEDLEDCPMYAPTPDTTPTPTLDTTDEPDDDFPW